jgi:hypothetical protein
LCRGERCGELSGQAERVGRPGAESARAAGGDGGALCAALGLMTGGAASGATAWCAWGGAARREGHGGTELSRGRAR